MKKKIIATLTSLIMTVTLMPTLSFATETHIDPTKSDTEIILEDAEDIASVIEDITGTSYVIDDINEENGEFVIDIYDTDITIPGDGNGEITIESDESEQLSMELLKEFVSMEGKLIDDDIIIYDDDNSNVSAAVQGIQKQHGDVYLEGIRSLLTIENSEASHNYSFNFNVPDGYQLMTSEEYNDKDSEAGYVYIVNEDNVIEEDGRETVDVMGVIAPAWAKDANGNNVNTSYIINGNTLTQSIEFDENSAFPIVADPTTTKYQKPDVAFDWSASAYNIFPIVMNLDSKQLKVVATATIGKISKTDTFYVNPGDTKKGKIKWDLKTSYKQNITVEFKISAKKRSTRTKTMSGSRKLDSYLINSWTKGGDKSKEAAIDKHFKKHSAEVGCSNNIKDYTIKAYEYRKKCKTGAGVDISNDLGPRYKFKFSSPKRYIMLTKNNSRGLIVSFGE